MTGDGIPVITRHIFYAFYLRAACYGYGMSQMDGVLRQVLVLVQYASLIQFPFCNGSTT